MNAPVNGQVGKKEGFGSIRALAAVPRQLWARLLGTSGLKKDYYAIFGWDRTIDSQAMWEMYHRGGIAKRLVHAYADATWGRPPTVSASASWTKTWNQLVEDQKLWSILHRLDRLTQLGQYAILLVGTDSPNLDRPLIGATKVLYLQPYSDQSAKITRWGTDPTDERFGLPVQYTIYPGREDSSNQTTRGGQPVTGANKASFTVHWSRVVHVAQGQMESEVFGTPMLWAVWNYLTDLMKVVGGASESYWLTANRGMSAEVDKEMDLDPADAAALTEEIQEYQDGLRRFIRTRGVKVSSLGSDVADPSGPFNTLVTLIAGTSGIPKRIMLGSEAAHNASTQDKGNWAEHVEEYRSLSAEPNFLKPLIAGLLRMGILPNTAKPVMLEWPDAYRLSPLEAGQLGNQIATAANNLGLAVKNVKNLLKVEEIRAIIGSAYGNRLFIDNSEKLPTTGTDPILPELPKAKDDQKAADGNTPKSGGGSGNTSTPTSDGNGSGDPTPPRK